VEINRIDAAMLKKMFMAGAKRLDANKDYINELNVFPVPDGDTGTNMTMTIMSAASEVAAIEEPDMESLSRAFSQGALRGARGNSGVILSQLLRGFARTVKECEYIDGPIAAEAFKRASETAYKAVMKPKEGTILTVARGMSEKAQDIFESCDDLSEAMRQVIEYGNYMLSLTPEMLPVLKQAGVVDSGGQGLMTIMEGAYDCLTGKEDGTVDVAPAAVKVPAGGAKLGLDEIETADIKYGYCTEFIIMLEKEFTEKDEDEVKEYLSSIGDSLVCVSDDEIVKIHVHTNDPGLAIQKGLTYGSLTKMKIDNMREGHNERLFRVAQKLAAQQAMEAAEKEKAKQGPPKEVGFVVVSIGDGMKEIFKGLGADAIVEGGQTMNPSTADILEAAQKVNAKSVFILPNNKNIILAANQAAEMCKDKKILVVPSTTVPQGISAMINFNAELSGEENREAMTAEMEAVRSAQVTFAVRDTTIDDKEVHQGDIMGLSDKGLAAVGSDIGQTVIDTLATMADEDDQIISLYYGSDVKEEDALDLADRIQELYPDCEVEAYSGGQPIYYYIFSVE